MVVVVMVAVWTAAWKVVVLEAEAMAPVAAVVKAPARWEVEVDATAAHGAWRCAAAWHRRRRQRRGAAGTLLRHTGWLQRRKPMQLR